MGFLIKAVKSVVKTVVGVVSKVIGGVFGFIVRAGGGGKKAKSVNTLNKSLDPEAFRKILLGRTAAPLDVRYWEVWGTNGTKFDEVIAVATHTINSYQETYFEDELGFNAAGAAQGRFNGVVTRLTKLGQPGQTALAVGAGQYDATCTFDGVAHIAFQWVPDDKKLPNGIPNRYTQVCEGALVYDPRRDSTVPGGSGTHRTNDQTTWAYATLDGNGVPIGRNNALQVLWYLLGWRIAKKDGTGTLTGEMELVAGRGIDPTDINMATFIAAANACEVAGYYTDVALSTENSHTANEDKLTCGGLIGQLIDPGGLWSYYANVDDTANVAVTLTDADVIDGTPVSWDAVKGMSEQFTGVVGKFVNPSATTLFQAFPYPMVRDATYEANLGKKVRKTQDFEQVLDSTLAQRLARLKLNAAQYQGEYAAGFNYRALLAQAWSVVRYTSERHGIDLLFRVWRQDISTENGIGMLLVQIDASIWTAGTVNAALAPGAGLKYDTTQQIAATGVTVAQVPMVGAGGTLADGFKISWTAPSSNVRSTEIHYRLVGAANWLAVPPVLRDITAVVIGPELSGALYEAEVRHISIHDVPGAWVKPPALAPAVTLGQFYLGTTGNVNYAAIAAAGGTANWSGVVDDNGHRPDPDADVTLANIAAGFTGQQPIATDADAVARILAMRGDNFARNGDLSESASGFAIGSSTAYLDLRALGLGWGANWTVYFAAGGASANCYLQINTGAYVSFTAKRCYATIILQPNNAVTTFTVSLYCKNEGGTALATQTKTFTTTAVSVPTIYEVTFDCPAGTASILGEVKRTSGDASQNQYVTGVRFAATQRAADVTATNVPKVEFPGSIQIEANSGNTTVTTLPLTARCKCFIGGVDVSATSIWSLGTVPAGISASINNTSDRGLITVTVADNSGNLIVNCTPPDNSEITVQIPVTRTQAPANAGGGAGASYVSDNVFPNVNSGTLADISDVMTIRSTAGGTLIYSANVRHLPSSGSSANVMGIKARYRTTAGPGAWTDFASEVTGSANGTDPETGQPTKGVVSIADTTKTGLTASTDYDVVLQGRRSSGSDTLVISNSSFVVRQS